MNVLSWSSPSIRYKALPPLVTTSFNNCKKCLNIPQGAGIYQPSFCKCPKVTEHLLTTPSCFECSLLRVDGMMFLSKLCSRKASMLTYRQNWYVKEKVYRLLTLSRSRSRSIIYWDKPHEEGIWERYRLLPQVLLKPYLHLPPCSMRSQFKWVLPNSQRVKKQGDTNFVSVSTAEYSNTFCSCWMK